MELDFAKKTTYIIYTEPYSNAGITREELLKIARDIYGVIGAHPYHINDELEVTLFYDYDIYDFIDDFKCRLDKLLKTRNFI